MELEVNQVADEPPAQPKTVPLCNTNRSLTRRVFPYVLVFSLGAVFGSVALLYAVAALLESIHGPKWSGTTRLVEELNLGAVKQGDKLPEYADTHDWSEFWETDETGYGTNTFEERHRGINLTIFWYRPPSTNDRIMHSAFLANGAKDYWYDRWFFYDPERMATHVRLALESAREQQAENVREESAKRE